MYLDGTSLLPVAFHILNVHPDNDASTNIALEIDFSNYQVVNGVQIPMHVQRLISGGVGAGSCNHEHRSELWLIRRPVRNPIATQQNNQALDGLGLMTGECI